MKNRRLYKTNIDDLFSAVVQLVTTKREPNNLEVMDFDTEKKKMTAM